MRSPFIFLFLIVCIQTRVPATVCRHVCRRTVECDFIDGFYICATYDQSVPAEDVEIAERGQISLVPSLETTTTTTKPTHAEIALPKLEETPPSMLLYNLSDMATNIIYAILGLISALTACFIIFKLFCVKLNTFLDC
ncbi:unnamed protein product, partial [Mesorhabditis spiculigera]